ncbi:GABA permease [Commensalibacter sp. Nvir]|uniref:amino acid permease n=1 Tax=Commensalibacter sp. Nvir TaxID=3069817 RepID=UPI002D4E3E7E|nr:GABA permease [Commensalibacter sp. Nvir]
MSKFKNNIKPVSQPTKKGELAHTLKRRHVVMISIGGIIGAGLFVGASAAINAAGPAVLFSYIITGFLIYFVMRMLGELVIENPQLGSFINHIRNGMGDNTAFIMGWGYWLFWISAIAAEAIAGGEIILRYFNISQDYNFLGTMVIGPILIISMMITNLFSVKGYGEFEFWFALIKVIAIALFIVVGAMALTHLFGHVDNQIKTYTCYFGFVPKGWLAIFTIIPTILFTVTGSEIATIAAAESDDPAENVAYATQTIIFRVMAFYIAAVAIILAILPWNETIPGISPFLMTLQKINIPYASDIMAFIILVAILSCLNSSIYATSRTLFELAEYDDAPNWLTQTNASGVPQRAILTASLIGIVISIIAVISPNLFFASLLSCAGSIIVAVYVAICISQINVRKKMYLDNRVPTFKMWLFPYLSWATIAAFVLIILCMLFDIQQRKQIVLSALTLSFIWLFRVLLCRLRIKSIP